MRTYQVRDKRDKGWFHVDNEYLNGFGKILGPIGMSVYISLCRHADANETCFPSQETIADEIGAGVRTVRDYIAKLAEYRIIAIEREREGRIWARNIYILLNKSEWKYPSQAVRASDVSQAMDAVSQAADDIHHRQPLPTKKTHRTIPIKKTHTAPMGAGGLGNEVINLFKDINPSFRELFKRKPQHAAAERLVTLHGLEKLTKIVTFIGKSSDDRFCPGITTPVQLEDKWALLEKYARGLKSEHEVKNKKANVAFV